MPEARPTGKLRVRAACDGSGSRPRGAPRAVGAARPGRGARPGSRVRLPGLPVCPRRTVPRLRPSPQGHGGDQPSSPSP
ncbi:hypothetical protein DDV93_04175 [Cereibacter johrii]|nr:hypothetical protein DDV93_04175 [Cereibacter johrii]